MTGNEIRRGFLDYFGDRGHAVVRSSPLVPTQDPTLLFTNSGMVQFKSVFLGEEKREYVRATTCQKCVRAGGKHNDLENVGRTARHHTFFEMLGNFSFGDYFKEAAIDYAWEFLTLTLGLPKERLWATIYRDDEEAYGLWQRVAGIPPDRIVRLGEKDNFWAMGDTGPCGPCSEIVIDQGPGPWACGRPDCAVGCDCDRYLELWNLVFMQYNRDASGALTPLPKPSIDTGMGLERVAAVMQGVPSNFLTDLLHPIITAVEELAERPYGQSEAADVSMRVIVDHARAATFLIADGVMPSNEWRGYVLRRIMRRGIRHGRLLGLNEPFMHRLVGGVVGIMGPAYPELREARGQVIQVIQQEEERFAETLDKGLVKISEYIGEQRARGDGRVSGRFLFTLYDTYGFPVDLAQEVFAEQGFTVTEADMADFETEMEAQRERARAGTAFTSASGQGLEVYGEIGTVVPATEFLGYDQMAAPARVIALVRQGRRAVEVTEGEEVEVILDRTPCYAESGGQVGDTGWITGRQGRGEILDTQLRGTGLFVHRVAIRTGSLREGEEVAVSVEAPRRQAIRLNHTGTHLLHAALRKILGTHVTQAGSLVAPDRLRFDFTHAAGLKDREVEWIEEMVNEKVRENISVDPFYSKLEEALRKGAIALFGEKYGGRVRVVKIGDFSLELCGGTHLDRTGQIGLFKIVSEGAVAAGVRRVEAVTGEGAVKWVAEEEGALREAARLLKTPPLEVPKRIARLLEESKGLERRLQAFEARLARSQAEEIAAGARQVGDVAVVAARLDGLDADGLRAVVDTVRERLGSGVIVLGSVTDGKVTLVSSVTKDLTKSYHAGKIVSEVAKAVGGGGGGKPEMAQAGGKEPEKLDQALALVYQVVARQGEVSNSRSE